MNFANSTRQFGAIFVACAIVTATACGESTNMDKKRTLNVPDGTFVYFTLQGTELRELTLPSGTQRKLMQFPIDGLMPSVSAASRISSCGRSLVADLSHKVHGTTSLYGIDLGTRTVSYLRSGRWPTCGLGDELFFYDVEPGVGLISLYSTSLADSTKAELLISGEYSRPHSIVVVDDRYIATYDPKLEAQIIFERTPGGARKIRVGENCDPVFWRSRTGELVCFDGDRSLRSQKLLEKPAEVLIDIEKEGIADVLHYWAEIDAILCLVHKGAIYSKGVWFRESSDLIAYDLSTGKSAVLASDVNINSYGFAFVNANPSGR